MYKYLLDSVEQVDWLAIGPLLIFFVFFCAILIRTWKSNSSYLERMSNMPLEDKND